MNSLDVCRHMQIPVSFTLTVMESCRGIWGVRSEVWKSSDVVLERGRL